MDPSDEINCPNCGKPTLYNRLECRHCGMQIGYPNVNKAKLTSERDALKKRYDDAKAVLKGQSLEATGQELEIVVAKKGRVIKNIDFEFLYQWVCDPDFELMPYAKLLDKGIRQPAKPEDDIARTVADAMLYGSFGRDINFGAITINGNGLNSYGAFSVIITEAISKNKASFLECNSYQFAEKYSFKKPLPVGYLAEWNDIFMLTIAKLSGKLTGKSVESDFPGLILKSDGDRKNDDFMEAHIFGNLTVDSIAEVRGLEDTVKGRVRKNDLKEMKRKLGSKWKP